MLFEDPVRHRILGKYGVVEDNIDIISKNSTRSTCTSRIGTIIGEVMQRTYCLNVIAVDVAWSDVRVIE